MTKLESMSIEQLNAEFTKVESKIDQQLTTVIALEANDIVLHSTANSHNTADVSKFEKVIKFIKSIIDKFISIVKAIGKFVSVSIVKLSRLFNLGEKKCKSLLKSASNMNLDGIAKLELTYQLNNDYVKSAKAFNSFTSNNEQVITGTMSTLRAFLHSSTAVRLGTVMTVGAIQKNYKGEEQNNKAFVGIHKTLSSAIDSAKDIEKHDPVTNSKLGDSNVLYFANDISNNLSDVKLNRSKKLMSKFELNILDGLRKFNKIIDKVDPFSSSYAQIMSTHIRGAMELLYIIKDVYSKIIDIPFKVLSEKLDECVNMVSKELKEGHNVIPHLKSISRAYDTLK